MRRLVLSLSLAVVILLQSALAIAADPPSNETPGNAMDPENLLYGTWYCIDYGFHGYTEYYWSFRRDGRFAYYVAGFEPPQGGGSIDSSVSERFVQGRFRENGITIECYDIKADSFFAWGNEWKYFSDREPALLAGMLLETPLQKSENADDFSLDFAFNGCMILRLRIDRGNPFDHYDMDFDYVETAATAEPANTVSLLEWASKLNGIAHLTEENVNEVRVGTACIFSESEKQSIPYRWRYLISDESLISVSSDNVKDTSGFNVMPGGDSAYRKIDFVTLAPGECVIWLRYGEYGETDWDGSFVVEHIYHIMIIE